MYLKIIKLLKYNSKIIKTVKYWLSFTWQIKSLFTRKFMFLQKFNSSERPFNISKKTKKICYYEITNVSLIETNPRDQYPSYLN